MTQQDTPSHEQKILSSQADLDPKDRPMPAMFEWCQKQHNTIVVLKSGRFSQPGYVTGGPELQGCDVEQELKTRQSIGCNR